MFKNTRLPILCTISLLTCLDSADVRTEPALLANDFHDWNTKGKLLLSFTGTATTPTTRCVTLPPEILIRK
jgi:hypothetical protein